MKASKIIASLLILIALSYAIAKIFLGREISVEASRVIKEKYTPFVSASGSISAQDNQMLVTVAIGESNISSVKLGQSAQITGNGFNGEYSAEVIKIGNSAKKVTVGSTKIVAVEVILKINNPDSALKSGFTAKAKIFTQEESEITVVPYSAVLQEDNREYVFVYENGIAQKTYIKTGRELSKGYEILGGLDADSIVVTTPSILNKNEIAVSVKPVEE